MGNMTLVFFRNEINKIRENSSEKELLNNLYDWFKLNRYILPKFYSNKLAVQLDYLPKSKIPAWCTDTKSTFLYNNLYYTNPIINLNPKTLEILPEKAIGRVWLFENDLSEGKPFPEKLAELFCDNNNSPIPSMQVDKMGDYYYFGDGCHRLYCAFLAGKTVKVDCFSEYLNIYDIYGNKI